MSGYLRRLVRNAQGASANLRPLAGSVYGDAPQKLRLPGETPETGAETEESVPSRAKRGQRRIPAIKEPATQPAAQPADLRVETTQARKADSRGAKPARIDSYMPLEPKREDAGQRTAMTASVSAFESKANKNERREERREERPVIESQPVQLAAIVQPVTRETAAGEKPAPFVPLHLQPAKQETQITARPARELPQMQSEARQPDVQVHIGRIEVIAAAPTAPAAAAPRPNRATSLADYLAGRSGRGQ